MSKSRHPIALRLEQHANGPTRLLLVVMSLPLIDGIFVALVIAGVLDTIGGIILTGLLVFGGSATLAVILAEMDDDPRAHLPAILVMGVGIILVAAGQAMIAPTLAGLVNLFVFERFAALVLLALAAKTASAYIGQYLPRPAVIVGLGVVASIDPSGAALVVTVDPELVARAAAAAGIGVAFALAVAATAPALRPVVDLDRFRFASAVALGLLPFALFGLVPTMAPLAVLGIAGVLAFRPAGAGHQSRAVHREPTRLDATDPNPDGTPREIREPAVESGDEPRAPWL